MLTRQRALDLIARVSQRDGISEILSPLGFHDAPLPLDDAGARALGVPSCISAPRLYSGRGALRALAVVASPNESVRAMLATLVRRVVQRAPHQLWLFVAIRDDGIEASIAAWQPNADRGRVCALVVHPSRPVESDAETLLALSAAHEGGVTSPDTLVHARWCEILGRDALSHRFYRALESAIGSLGDRATGSAPSEARRSLALLTTSRLLFLSFLQGKRWLDGDADFLSRHVDTVLESGGDIHSRLFEPLFFGTLNTPLRRRAAAARAFGVVPFLNGGLFARSPLESRHRSLRFRDEDVAALFDDVLTRYRFSPREEQRDWSEAAVDPEMLGRAFESLMASRERRDSGAYYTPHALVTRVSEGVLDEALHAAGLDARVRDALREGRLLDGKDAEMARAIIPRLRVLDPACGTGAFLVHVLELLAAQLRLTGEQRGESTLRRALLTHSIFGVDINPMAVWLCELRLWLSVVIGLPDGTESCVPPLPNLDRNIRVGDALSGGTFEDGRRATSPAPYGVPRASVVDVLRSRYARATGARKHSLARQLDLAERKEAIADADHRMAQLTEERRTLVTAARGHDLFGARRGALGSERLRLEELRKSVRAQRAQRCALMRGGALPFRFSTHFSDVAAGGGFDIVVGNPPWVRLHRIPPERREELRREFRVFREAAWKRGADDAAAGAGFSAQVDLSALFVERGMSLTRVGGLLAYLLPVKLWRSLAGGGVRQLLGKEHELVMLEDWSEAPSAFDAAVYPSIVMARRRRLPSDGPASAPQATGTRLGLHRRDLAIAWSVSPDVVPFDASPGAPWLLLPPEARTAFSRLSAAGPALADAGIGRPTLGVKSGCNAAFVVRESLQARGDITGEDGRRGEVEPSLLRPVLRGERVRRWIPAPNDERILWTHDVAGRPMRPLPPLASRWLSRFRSDLARRADARPGTPWWSLFRTEAATSDRPRVVWADLSRGPRACVLVAGSPWVPLNSCYTIVCRDNEDAATLAAIFNSPLAAAWLDAIAEPARGGFRRYLGWTVARLPLPNDWARAREVLAPIARRGVCGDSVSDAELLDAVIAAYRVRAALVLPLIEWTWR